MLRPAHVPACCATLPSCGSVPPSCAGMFAASPTAYTPGKPSTVRSGPTVDPAAVPEWQAGARR